ncbi:FAD NAD(P)-binding oxidoreductase [Raphidocelis subcapitata]|uniref:Ubiquinone biosynthesis monooxygenase COQ6, mitochondrial n=1 Tax=Raphidocelis subcapitata TaxID=307507 RepID=A0A2V0NW92_9CHLO|nr:FAD NAD(P)-binding oxidoreductase [Raphidocelis subcapitata]|eukprot:GBF91599.1 FAD NAD(P)-binding oxidoreductase [Raphidocelis subcapitata]
MLVRSALAAGRRRGLATAAGADDVYDVAIVGAGMVGAAVAALLRGNPLTADLRVAVLDRTPPPLSIDPPPHPGLRVSTITPASIQTLARAGAWAEVAPPHSAEFSDMQVWDSAGPGHVRWAAADVGAPRMGVVAENDLLQAALLRAAADASRPGRPVELIAPAALESLRLPPEPEGPSSSGSSGSTGGGGAANALAELRLSCGRALRCRLVVGADGGRSRVRELAGLRTVGWSYHQRGLVATVETDAPNSTAWQRFLPDGPLALLPVRGGCSNIVWTVAPEGAARLEAMGSSEFADAVNAALHDGGQRAPTGLAGALAGALRAGASLLPGGGGGGGGSAFVPPPRVLGFVGSPPKSFPLQMQHSGRYALPRLALVGDAAHTVHPLAGQGVNLGLGDAAALADALAGAREVGRDIGELPLLRADYESPRQAANLAMMAALEGIQRAFCMGGAGGAAAGPLGAAVGAARAAGLGVVGAAGPLRRGLMRYAMGLPPAPWL